MEKKGIRVGRRLLESLMLMKRYITLKGKEKIIFEGK
jgi:hypothetical protein